MENKVFFAMNAIQFGSIVPYIKETDTYEYRYEYDGASPLGYFAAENFRVNARWLVRKTNTGYLVRDQRARTECLFYKGEAVAAFLRGVFYYA